MLKCWDKYLNTPIYFRDIDEINRPKCMEWDLRNLYDHIQKMLDIKVI